MSRYLNWLGVALVTSGILLALTAGKGLAQEEPSVVITAPAQGEVLAGPDVTVDVALSGFTISLPLEPKREPNTGHIAYFLDVEPLFDVPTPLGDDRIIHSGRLSETFVGVADGEYTVYVCLVYDDNTCIDPALTDSVQISVGQPPPTAIPSPESTPTPAPPEETPVPPPPTPSPIEEPPPASPTPDDEPVVVAGAATPTPVKPSPTARTPAATPVPGTAPGTCCQSGADDFVWLYVVVGVGAAALAAVAVLTGRRLRQARSRN